MSGTKRVFTFEEQVKNFYIELLNLAERKKNPIDLATMDKKGTLYHIIQNTADEIDIKT